jgi:hypothetical protein
MKQLKVVGGVLMLLLVVWCSLHQKEARRAIISAFETNSEEKEEIRNQIENAYLNVFSGSYSQPNDLPFYNQNAGTITMIGFLPMFTLSGESGASPENIQVIDVADKTATVEYDLDINKKGSHSILKIKMIVKKIGGNWKLDAQKFFPVEE